MPLQVMSKGRMVSSSAISFSASTENTFSYTVSGRDLAPKASLVVYYVTESGELIVDSLIFQVAGAFSNDVSIIPGQKPWLFQIVIYS